MTTNPENPNQRNINDQLKAKIDEIDFDAKITQVTEAAHKAFEQIREQAATLLTGNRGKVDEIIDKAAGAFDEKTDGKYHDKVEKAKVSFASGLDKIQDAPGAGDPDAGGDASVYESPDHRGSDAESVLGADEGQPNGPSSDDLADVGADPASGTATVDPVVTDAPDSAAWSSETDKLS